MTKTQPDLRRIDEELHEIVSQASEAYARAEASGHLDRLRSDSEASIECRLRDLGSRADCPPEELSLVLAGELRPTQAMLGVRHAVALGWRTGRGPRPWILLAGTVGAGKTTAAVWALLHGTLDGEQQPCPGERIFVPSRAVAKLNPGYGPDRAKLEHMGRVRWLVFDDLGYLDTAGEHFAPAVQDLLEERYTRRRPTVITTNITRNRLIERMGEAGPRFSDRLRHVACELVTREQSLRGGTP